MSSVGSNDDVNILVLLDRIPGFDSRYGDWREARRFYITQGMEPWADNGVSLGEANLGDPQTLIDFVQWGMTNYPAERYAVVIWDHGIGWRSGDAEDQPLFKGVCYDDSNGSDALEMPEIRGVMDTLSNGGADPVDLVGFDACAMGMIEVDNQLMPYVDVRVASEAIVPLLGWPYDTILSTLTGDPSMPASQLGVLIVDEYYASYDNGQVHSAVDLHSPFDTLITAVDDFAVALSDGVGSYGAEIASARGSTQEFWPPTYIDLYDLAYQVNQHVSNATINAAAVDVMDALDNAVIRERHGSEWPGAHGMSIYFPDSAGDYDGTYDGSQGWLEFTANTRWDEWLHAFYGEVACGDSHEPNEAPGQATFIGHGATLSDAAICPAGDVDYYAFSGNAGDSIVADIDAAALGSSLDSYLYLYDTDGVTELAQNDDYDGYDSLIEYVLPADGTYYLKVREYNHPNEGSPDHFYTLSLTSPPGPATLISPAGAIADTTPIYTWEEAPRAITYRLSVQHLTSGAVVYSGWYPAAGTCDAGTCSVMPPVTLGDGPHRWWVQTWNEYGYGPWSDPLDTIVGEYRLYLPLVTKPTGPAEPPD
jgi:clostripain